MAEWFVFFAMWVSKGISCHHVTGKVFLLVDTANLFEDKVTCLTPRLRDVF